MGDWQTDWSRDALERIAVLLFALAGLADRAAGAPFLRRRRVLGILNWGEVEARAFVIGMVCDTPVPAEAEPSGDAVCLATRLRALALALCVLLARRTGLPGAAGPRVDREMPVWRADRAAAQPAPDTS